MIILKNYEGSTMLRKRHKRGTFLLIRIFLGKPSFINITNDIKLIM